jgi:hypothetical protein
VNRCQPTNKIDSIAEEEEIVSIMGIEKMKAVWSGVFMSRANARVRGEICGVRKAGTLNNLVLVWLFLLFACANHAFANDRYYFATPGGQRLLAKLL